MSLARMKTFAAIKVPTLDEWLLPIRQLNEHVKLFEEFGDVMGPGELLLVGSTSFKFLDEAGNRMFYARHIYYEFRDPYVSEPYLTVDEVRGYFDLAFEMRNDPAEAATIKNEQHAMALLAAGVPTKKEIAKQVGVDVRTLYNYPTFQKAWKASRVKNGNCRSAVTFDGAGAFSTSE